MKKLDDFAGMLTGHFDNKEQYENFLKEGKEDYPYAEHINTVCNSKIVNLPDDFNGIFIVEESYYTVGGNKRADSHIFLFTEEGDEIKLTSYEIPDIYDRNSFTFDKMQETDYRDLKVSEKFTPAFYRYEKGTWKGGSESMFTPVLKFKLYEEFSENELKVSEIMELNGRRTFGYDDPIIYKRR